MDMFIRTKYKGQIIVQLAVILFIDIISLKERVIM